MSVHTRLTIDEDGNFSVYTDELFRNDLYYAAGSFGNNLGDGDRWVIEQDNLLSAQEEIKMRLGWVIDEIFSAVEK